LATLPSDWPELEYFALPAYVGDFEFPGVGGPTDGNYATLMVTLIAPMSRGNVSISSSSMHVHPLINPNWLTNQADIDVAIAAFKRLRQIYQTPVLQQHLTIGPEYYPGASVSTDEEILQWIQTAFQTMYHASSTCKMGTDDDPMAVVDPKGRVYGTKHCASVPAYMHKIPSIYQVVVSVLIHPAFFNSESG
jgi:choline dehydrogenase